MFVLYNSWYPDEEPEVPSEPPAIIQQAAPVEQEFNNKQLDPDAAKDITSQQECVDKGGVWMYDECVS